MGITKHKFEEMLENYQYYSSWAVWSEAGEKAKSNVGDLGVFDFDQNPNLLEQLNPNFVLVALNISRGEITEPLANFHDPRPEATDFKIRYALKGTPLWGAYMTDIIKDYENKLSNEVRDYLKIHPNFVLENVNRFNDELRCLDMRSPTLIAFGNEVYDILNRYLGSDFKILRIKHYAYRQSKEEYRDHVLKVLRANGIEV